MATHEHIATSADFSDITCPYTGRPVTTVMVLNGVGEPLFRAADGTYSPKVHCPSQAVAALNAARRAGADHARPPFRDAYTGEPIGEPEEDDDGWWFPLAFSPLRARTRGDYLHFMHMRDGRPDPRFPRPSAAPRIRASRPPEPVRSARQVRGQDVGQDSIEFAKAAVESSGCAERTPSVTVPSGKRRRRR